MNQQEIKENLPPLPLHANDEHGFVKDNKGKRILSTETLDYEIETDVAVDHAIVHAINNTYGKGINPESVSEMYNTLQGVVLILQMLNEPKTAQDIQDILNKAAL